MKTRERAEKKKWSYTCIEKQFDGSRKINRFSIIDLGRR